MPEIITKHPDIVLKLLNDVHIQCGTGAPQKILTQCPKEQFCALPKGELCIYDSRNISSMTQLHPLDFVFSSTMLLPAIGFSVMVFLLGLWVGTTLVKRS